MQAPWIAARALEGGGAGGEALRVGVGPARDTMTEHAPLHGIAEFTAKENQFLTFEKGPSQDIILQWATYHDAADQCSLSRIWGGIHPLQDDLPGRIIGRAIGNNAFNLAEQYFSGKNNN